MRKRRIILLIALLIFLVPTLITALALQNPPWVHSPIVRNAESFISHLILSRVDVVAIPKDQDLERVPEPSSLKLQALEKGEIDIVSASDLPDKIPGKLLSRFVIVTIEPIDLMGKSGAEQRRIIRSVDDLAIQKRIDMIVEATASDVTRSSSWSPEEMRRLHDSGVIRCVIFDGGHHVGALSLQPDILLVPVVYYNGEPYAGHWFTRDAVPVGKLKKALQEGGTDSIIAQFPRFGIPVKNRSGMAGLAIQAIFERMGNKGGRMETDKNLPSPPASSYDDDGLRKGFKFLSLSIGREAEMADILEKVGAEIQKSERHGEKIERIYIGLTCGYSKFPHVGKKESLNREKIEILLNKHLPCEVSVISEPLSTWDIYLNRLRISR